MTLNEAIKHAEEIIVENLEKTKDRNASDPIAINCFECAEEHRQLAEWLKELKQLREQTRWIPVEARLPEQYEEVIVTDIETSDTYTSRYIGYGFWDCDNGSYRKRIIAWQPKPKPYKAESEE